MTQNFRSVLAGAGLILAMLACNMPFEQLPPPNDVQTAAALTLQAILTPSLTSPAQIANNLIKYHPHTERFIFPVKPSASPSGVFVCIEYTSLRAFFAKQSPGCGFLELHAFAMPRLATTFEIR